MSRRDLRFYARGFTVLEMVMVIVLLGIVAGLGAIMLQGGFDAYFAERDVSDAAWQGRFAMERLNRELRAIRSATAGDLTMSPASEISFVDTTGTAMSYALSGTILTRNGQPLADGISSLNFSYIANDGKTTAADATQVYYVAASFTVIQGGASLPLRTLIHPRNFP